MSGYRQSSYDPAAAMEQGKPLRPYNWVQRTGVAIGGVGVLISLFDSAARLGWITPSVDVPPLVALALIITGVTLVNLRRQPIPGDTRELAAARKRWLIITVFACAALIGVAAVLEFTGA